LLLKGWCIYDMYLISKQPNAFYLYILVIPSYLMFSNDCSTLYTMYQCFAIDYAL